MNISQVLKHYGHLVTAAASLSAFGAAYFKDELFADFYKNTFHLYRFGLPAALEEDVKRLCEEVCEKALPDPKKRNKVVFFPVSIMDVTHIGTTHSFGHVYIGIPPMFRFRSEEDVSSHSVQLPACESVDWFGTAGSQLRKSLVLSADAQKFAVAREIFLSDNKGKMVDALLSGTFVINQYLTANFFNQRFRLPPSVRYPFYGLVGSLWLTMCIAIRGIYIAYCERESDLRTCSLGADYVNGGIEFYEKYLLRNIALRVLLGSYGERRYTSKGNFSYWLLSPHAPLTTRLEKIRSLVVHPAAETKCEVCELIGGGK